MPVGFLDKLKENAWIVAIVLFFVAIFRDVLKTAVTKVLTGAWEKAYGRLAGNRLFRRRALAKYRRELLRATEKIAVPFRPNRPLSLQDIYIELKISSDGRGKPMGVWDVVADHARVVVTGPPGAGKSMLLRHLASARARKAASRGGRAPVPVLLELHRLARRASGGESIEDHLVDAFERYGFPRARKFLDLALERGWLVLLFDGLDEVPTGERPEVAARLTDFLERERACPAIVTCRSAVYRGEFDAVADRRVELEPFGDQQIQDFLNSWSEPMPAGKSPAQLMASLREQPKLLNAARNPLLLTIITHLYSESREYVLPRSRAEFYKQAAEILLDQWQRHLGQNQFDGPEKRNVLANLALEMQRSIASGERDRRTIDRERAIAVATGLMPGLGRDASAVAPILREIVERSGLLLAIDGGARYAFAHLTFQEYFAAHALLSDPGALIDRFSDDADAWREVVALWCGLVPDCTEMIEKVREVDADVALACVAEAGKVEPDVAAAILDGVVEAVVSGTANEQVQRSLGSVAADVRPRGERVLRVLIEALRAADSTSTRLSIATALGASNRTQAAEAVVGQMEADPELIPSVIRLGDLAVPSLTQLASRSADPAICACLAQIGTAAAAAALAEIMLDDGDLATPAAWGVASVIGSAPAREKIATLPVPGPVRQRQTSLTWIWTPFADTGEQEFVWIVGRAAYLIGATQDFSLAVATPDARIATALCAVEPNLLRTPFTDSPPTPRLLEATEVLSGYGEFTYREDGAIVVEGDRSRSSEFTPRSAPGLRQGTIHGYRELVDFVFGGRYYPQLGEPTASAADMQSVFVDALLESMGTNSLRARLLRELPGGLLAMLLGRLGRSGQVNRETWQAVSRRELYRFERSRSYIVCLAIAFLTTALAGGGAMILLFEESIGSPVSLLALVGIIAISSGWAWIFVESSPANGYAGTDWEALAAALLGIVIFGGAVLDSLRRRRPNSDWDIAPTIGLTPALCWLSVSGLAHYTPLSVAIGIVGALVATGFLVGALGIRHEARFRTPLAGLFLDEQYFQMAI